MTGTGSRAPLRYSPFRLLVVGRTVTALGNAVAPIALAFAVLDLTGSVRDLGLVVGAQSTARVLFLLAGGVVADRFPRQLVMVGAGVLSAATQAVIATLVLTGTATVPLLMVLAAVSGMFFAFAFPAAAALVPQTVPQTVLQQANAINRLGFSSGMIGGAAAGGALVALVGPGWGLAVDAATFAVGAVCFALVRVPDIRDHTAPRRGILTELREGWTEFVSRTWLWVVVLGFMVINAVHTAAIAVLGPAVADETIGRGAWGLVLAAEMTGMVVGALLAMRIQVRRLLLFGVVCVAGELFLITALAVAPRTDVLLVAALLAGLAVEQFSVAWETTMQEHVPADKLARVYSYDMLGSFVAIPGGQVSAGPAAVAIGTEATLLVGAGLMGVAVVGMIASRDVRRLEHRTSSDVLTTRH
jgi:MFS family permease